MEDSCKWERYIAGKEKVMEDRGRWIWYPGDMELYYALKQNFSRIERGMGWPAFWKSDGYRNRIILKKKYDISKDTSFTVFPCKDAVGYVLVNGDKRPFGKKIECKCGEVDVAIHLGCIPSFPSAYVEGDIIYSDDSWLASDYENEDKKVGHSVYFVDKDKDTSEWHFSEKIYTPADCEETGGGVLFSFDEEITAKVELTYKNGYRPYRVYIGESRQEALDTDKCYSFCDPGEDGICEKNAVHYVFIKGCSKEDVSIAARHQFVDIPVRARIECDDIKIKKIWDVAEKTFKLCSGIFYIDGVKRDRWIWGGDAYQSMYVGNALFNDPDINRRTYRALFGNQSPATHINTIVDYSMLCIIGVFEHVEQYKDIPFLEEMYPKLRCLTELLISQTNEYGFVCGREKDWIFIDWADFDQEGPLCAEQVLLAEVYRVMGASERILGISDSSDYYELRQKLLENIEKYYWDNKQKAYIDSYKSGKKHVTRHANIFAIRYDIADESRKKEIVNSVILNDAVPQITTPYFKFFEQDALCKMGFLDRVFEIIKSYWGGMIDLGADTFWEEYDPSKSLDKQYEMYGDPYGKSMCHAWSSSPIYLLTKYYNGKNGIHVELS